MTAAEKYSTRGNDTKYGGMIWVTWKLGFSSEQLRETVELEKVMEISVKGSNHRMSDQIK